MRPPKRTPERKEKILALIRAGNTRRTAAMACGIGERTLYEWLEKDPQFAQAIKEADAIAEARMVSRIIDAAKESWQAAAWWLERRRPDDYKRPDRVELLGSKSDPVRIEVVYVDEPIKQEHD